MNNTLIYISNKEAAENWERIQKRIFNIFIELKFNEYIIFNDYSDSKGNSEERMQLLLKLMRNLTLLTSSKIE